MVDYSLVIPAYNELKRIGRTIHKYISEWDHQLNRLGKTYELIVVANGCTDTTPLLVRMFSTSLFPSSPLRLLVISQANKGLAVLEGFRAAKGKVVGFTDADGSISPATMLEIMQRAEQGKVVIGSRYLPGTECRRAQPLVRRIASRGWHFLVRLLLGLRVTDTQAGAKAMPAEYSRAIQDHVVPCYFAFDVSLLWEAKKAGYEIVEVPVVWEHSGGSKFKLYKEVWRMFWALVLLRFAPNYGFRARGAVMLQEEGQEIKQVLRALTV